MNLNISSAGRVKTFANLTLAPIVLTFAFLLSDMMFVLFLAPPSLFGEKGGEILMYG